MSRTNPCNKSVAKARLKSALAFAQAADLFAQSSDENERSVCVSNAVSAGIAAADVICCCRLGEYSSSSEHQDAIELLKNVYGVGADAAKALRTLLDSKNKAQYGFDHPNADSTKRCMRAMKKLIEFAKDAAR